MKSEVEFGSLVYADGTISKRTRLHFDSEDAMWSYYDSLEKGANAQVNIYRNIITLNEEWVPVAEYRAWKAASEEE